MPGLLDALKDPEFRRQVLQGLTDAGNRGLAAGLGGPVDLAELVINAGLGLAGQKPISNSVGGSEWIGQQMQRVGSVSDVRNPSAEFLASLLMPGASVKGAKVIGKAVDNAQKPGTVARAGERGAIVYHGTPHKFDKFDSSKIGTGEGAQAYGHGLYLADSPEVAAQYQHKLSYDYKYNGRRPADGSPLDYAIRWLKNLDYDKEAAKAQWKDQGKGAKIRKAIDEFDINKYQEPGNLYSVDLPDDQIAKMLDWDKPLSQQSPEVQAAMRPILIRQIKPYTGVDGATRYMVDIGGAQRSFKSEDDAMSALSSELDGASAYLISGEGPQSSKQLAGQGIPGIRYLDGGSRGTGTGTSNFVVFPGNEDMLKILERNGKPLK